MVETEPVPLLPLLEQVAAAQRVVRGGASLTVVESTLAAGLMPPLHAHEDDEAFTSSKAASSSTRAPRPCSSRPATRSSPRGPCHTPTGRRPSGRAGSR